jgi:cytosine/adenosine deaminase-related metal-dependent hydrolase
MLDSPQTISLTARYVFPVAGPPLAGGCVTIRGEQIVAVDAHPTHAAIDLGDVAILPGLVNAHAHLEFSHHAVPLGRPGMPLPEWIRLIIASRRAADSDPVGSIARGLTESVQAGTTTLGDIATSGWTEQSLASARTDLTAFYESIGLQADRVDERLADAEQFVAQAIRAAGWRGALSPHAPYSVHPELVVGLMRLAAAHRLPVAMHLAESREELLLLADGEGPFRAMLEELGVWDPSVIPRGTRPLEYLHLLAAAPRALVIHGNYLAADELEFLAMNSERMSVVFCPRTHAYFGHERYPLDKLLALGAMVALGTDGRASNPDLSMLAEMRCVARQFPAIPPDVLLRLGTLAGAKALGCQNDAGSLETGKPANLAIVAISPQEVANPHDLIFESDLPIVQTFYRGRPLTSGSS